MTDWIAIDWGTSNLRVWLIGPDGAIRDQRASDQGMGGLDRDGFEPALLALIGDWLPADRVTPALACGMVGARQGWVEAPYAAVPCKPAQTGGKAAPVRDPRMALRILPGLYQTSPRADVMRGEETQVAGYLAAHPNFDGVICLPGTHTKWVHVSAGEVVSFQTVMTGELFALLTGQSVLRHSVQGDGWDEAAFDAGVDDTLSRPAGLTGWLFELRAADLVQGQPAATARARLSGLLIGAELAGTKPYWLGQPVALIGDPAFAALYARALQAQGVQTATAEAQPMTLAGLAAAYYANTGGGNG